MYGMDYIKALLASDGPTLALTDGEALITRRERGVKPLVELIDGGRELRGYIAADKVVGKAAAMLYAVLGIAELYACVASEGAVEVCRKRGIRLTYGTLAPHIINRRGDGSCPMEKAVADIDDPFEALAAVRKTLAALGAGKQE